MFNCNKRTFTAGLPLWWEKEGRQTFLAIKELYTVVFAVISGLACFYALVEICYLAGLGLVQMQWAKSLLMQMAHPHSSLQLDDFNKLTWLFSSNAHTEAGLTLALFFIGLCLLAPISMAARAITRICQMGRAAVAFEDKIQAAKAKPAPYSPLDIL